MMTAAAGSLFGTNCQHSMFTAEPLALGQVDYVTGGENIPSDD